MNCLDLGPCIRKWAVHVSERKGPSLVSAPPNSHVSVNRDIKSLEATQEEAASPHSGRAARGSGRQQSKHVAA